MSSQTIIEEGAIVGKDCEFGAHVFIAAGAHIGDRVTIRNGVSVWSGVTLENDVYVGPGVAFCNRKFPSSALRDQATEDAGAVLIHSFASLGANSTILPGIDVGVHAIVGAGAVVTHNVTAKSVVTGNPARHLRFVDAPEQPTEMSSGAETLKQPTVKGTKLLHLPEFCDRRGKLSFAQYDTHLPWKPARYFIIYDVPQNEVRGYHSHRTCQQLYVCISGRVNVLVDNGTTRETVVLDKRNQGLLLECNIWSVQNYFEPGSSLLVLCSEEHKNESYCHDYATFIKERREMEEPPVARDSEVLVRVPFLDVKASAMMVEDGIRAAFDRVLTSGRYVLGPEVEAFEREFASFCGAKYCVGVSSGLAALQLMLQAADIGPGDEVIVASNTYIATALAVSATGATPVFAEPHALTRNIDAAQVELAVTESTRAILSVDLYGVPADASPLEELAARRGLLLFSDAAQSHGGSHAGRPVGSYGAATATSFYPSKNLGALGEAGAVLTNDEQLARRVRRLRNYGSEVRYQHEEKGRNERMDPMQAAMLRCKLPRLAELNARRALTAHRYLEAFKDLAHIALPVIPEGIVSSWHLFVIATEERDRLSAFLKERLIDSVVHYPIPPHLSHAYADLKLGVGSFPIAEKLADTVLSLPICPHMTTQQVDAVIRAVLAFK